MRMQLLARMLREEDGSALPEFALSATVLFMVIFGIMDCSRALDVDHFVANAAREATRYAMVRGATFKGKSCASATTEGCYATSDNVTAYVRSIVPAGMSTTPLAVTATWSGNGPSGGACTNAINTDSHSPGCVVVVKVNYSFNFVLAYLPSTTLLLGSSSSVTIAQ